MRFTKAEKKAIMAALGLLLAGAEETEYDKAARSAQVKLAKNERERSGSG